MKTIILLVIIATTVVPNSHSHFFKIALYCGSGAVYHKDVEIALKKNNIEVQKIDEYMIKQGKLKNFKTLIIPGGATQVILNSLKGAGFEQVRKFVRGGGKYIGICAGAYLAPKEVKLRFGRKKAGLNIIDIENKREAGIGLREIEIVGESEIAKGYSKGKIKIWYQNGPYIRSGKGVKVVARYKKDFAAIVWANFGKGKVILFSPHPEGNLENEIDPEKIGTLNLLKNAIRM